MTLQVDPRRFLGKPMMMKELAEGDYLVYADGMVVGWIMCSRPGGQGIWHWTMTGPNCASAAIATRGECSGADDALKQITAAFQSWLDSAVRDGRPVLWQSRRTGPDMPGSR